MASNREILVARYPELFHVCESGMSDSIVRHGLRSTKNLLKLFEVDDSRRIALVSQRREASVFLSHPSHGTAYVRDQVPLSLKRLGGALTDMTVSAWLELLNSLCFFWPTRKRVEDLLRAPHYADRDHDVLVIDTSTLVARHAKAARLSAINTGATRPFAHPRGSDTFLPLEAFPLEERLSRVGRAGAVAEVTVEDEVPEIRDMLLRVERWSGATQRAASQQHIR
jgi:hypothetical protein